MAVTLQDIMSMIVPSSDQMQLDADRSNNALAELQKRRMMQRQMIKEMDRSQAPSGLSLPAAENMPNYANNEMPLYTGGLLQNPAGNMVDPQMLMNTAYDMSAPREMRINAIERLRALGVI